MKKAAVGMRKNSIYRRYRDAAFSSLVNPDRGYHEVSLRGGDAPDDPALLLSQLQISSLWLGVEVVSGSAGGNVKVQRRQRNENECVFEKDMFSEERSKRSRKAAWNLQRLAFNRLQVIDLPLLSEVNRTLVKVQFDEWFAERVIQSLVSLDANQYSLLKDAAWKALVLSPTSDREFHCVGKNHHGLCYQVNIAAMWLGLDISIDKKEREEQIVKVRRHRMSGVAFEQMTFKTAMKKRKLRL